MIARLRLIIKRTSPLVSRYGSIAVLAVGVCIVLAALSLAKLGLGRNVRAEQGALETRTVAASDVTASSARPVPLAKKDTLVYIIDGDSKYYHTCAHGSSDAQRQAVTITVAKARNLAPCPVCASKMQ